MSVDLVPETAPFSPAQRAWLNGFLAGMLGTLDTSHNDPSQLVSAQRIAPLLSPEDRLPAASSASVTSASDEVTAEEAPWHDPTLPVTDRMALAAGRPLAQRMMAAMAQLNCGSCGYQCQTYAEALASGAEKNLSLCSPGGNETAKLLRQLHKERTALPASTTSTALVSSAASAEPSQTSELAQPRESGSRSQPIIARIKSNVPLNQSGSAKDTRHVAIALQGTPLKYRVGDALGILPTNCPQLVQQVCNAAGLAPQTLVPVKGCRQSLE
jgi:sulfite reductase (NADPH) flavoprotein alpha-component